MSISDKDKAILKGVFGSIPQVQAVNIIRDSVSPHDMAQQIMLHAGLQSLTIDQQEAVIRLMSLNRDGRVVLAGELIGKAIEESGIIQRVFKFLFGWL